MTSLTKAIARAEQLAKLGWHSLVWSIRIDEVVRHVVPCLKRCSLPRLLKGQ